MKKRKMTTITDQIESYILSGCTGKNHRKIGAEMETIFYNNSGRRLPVNPGNEFSATEFLSEIDEKCKEEKTFATCSLEPGGQVEWASKPVFSIHHIQEELNSVQKNVKQVCQAHDLAMIDLSLEPIYNPFEIDLIRQPKYELMNKRFLKTGKHGPWMMRNTTSVQINIDILSKEDGEEMAFLSDVLQPFSALLFANCPFMNGQPTGTENIRYKIWSDTDSARCGYLMEHSMTKPNGLIHEFSRWVQDIPAIFIYNENDIAVPFNGTLGEYLMSLETVGKKEVLSVLHQVFTHVRFKHVVEVRSPDRPPAGFEMAPAAFWGGLLTSKIARDKSMKIAESFSMKDRILLNNLANTLDLNQGGPQNKSLQQWMEIICNLALDGLDERSIALGIKNEREFLELYLESFFSNGFLSLQIQKAFHKKRSSLKSFIMK